MLKCQHCGALLTVPPERDRGEWIIRCFACGMVNLIQPTLEIIGYRAASDVQRRKHFRDDRNPQYRRCRCLRFASRHGKSKRFILLQLFQTIALDC
jgi:hypothetical protein